nr:MarR family transcriptional regulator [uncultured Holophaga sp.]
MSHRTDPTVRVIDRMRLHWPQLASPAFAVSVQVQRLARLLEEGARRTLGAFALSTTEFEVLAAMRAHPAPFQLTPSELYDAVLISSGGLTKVLKGLESRRLVDRPQSSDDRRSRPIRLTPEGRTLIEAAMAAVQGADSPIFGTEAPDLGLLEASLSLLTARAEALLDRGETSETLPVGGVDDHIR